MRALSASIAGWVTSWTRRNCSPTRTCRSWRGCTPRSNEKPTGTSSSSSGRRFRQPGQEQKDGKTGSLRRRLERSSAEYLDRGNAGCRQQGVDAGNYFFFLVTLWSSPLLRGLQVRDVVRNESISLQYGTQACALLVSRITGSARPPHRVDQHSRETNKRGQLSVFVCPRALER